MSEADFDRVARVYRWAEYASLGRTLERAREFFLPQLVACRSVLALGDGDGRFLARLLRQSPEMRAVAVDSSAEMLRLLRGRCGGRVRAVQGSAMDVVAEAGTDLVVTHFFLDCFGQDAVDELVRRVGGQVQAGTLWVVSDFGMPRVRWLRPFAAVYVRALYLAFRMLTGLRVTRLPDPQRAMANAGFTRLERQEFLLGLIYTELWQRQ